MGAMVFRPTMRIGAAITKITRYHAAKDEKFCTPKSQTPANLTRHRIQYRVSLVPKNLLLHCSICRVEICCWERYNGTDLGVRYLINGTSSEIIVPSAVCTITMFRWEIFDRTRQTDDRRALYMWLAEQISPQPSEILRTFVNTVDERNHRGWSLQV